MSVVQVFVGPEMACVGHLVDESTIGGEVHLGLDSSLRYTKWRAMVIKDNKGDWGLCAGGWVGMKEGVKGRPGRPGHKGIKGIPGSPGHFKMYYNNLRTGSSEKVVLPQGNSPGRTRKYRFSTESGMSVDLDNGEVIVTPEVKDVVQHVALAFCTSLLYLVSFSRFCRDSRSDSPDFVMNRWCNRGRTTTASTTATSLKCRAPPTARGCDLFTWTRPASPSSPSSAFPSPAAFRPTAR